MVKWTTSAIEAVHTNDFLEFIDQIGFVKLNDLKPLYSHYDPYAVEDKKLRATLLAGMAKMFSLEGNLIAAKEKLDEAMSIVVSQNDISATPVRDEVLAYVKYEAGLYHRLLKDMNGAEICYREAQNYAVSYNLNVLIKYQIETLKIETGKTKSTTRLRSLADEFKTLNMPIMHILGYHRLGIIHRKLKKYEDAKRYYAIALENAYRENYIYLVWLIQNAIGFLFVVEKKYDEAFEIFNSYVKESKSHMQKSKFTENLALIYYYRKEYDLAVDYCYRALTHSTNNHVFSQIPDECLFLGEVYDKNLKQTSKAKYYYKMGYDQALYQISRGLSLNGPREEAVNKYVEFLQNYFPEKSGAELPGHIFDFALNKRWQEIKDIFQYNLVVYHKLETKPDEDMFKKLNMKSTTYYSLQAKLAKKGFAIPDFRKKEIQFAGDQILESLQGYIRNLRDITWEGANKNFEKDMFRYLFRKYGYQKTKLSKVLNLSYPVVVARTKELTQSIEIFREQPSLNR